MGPCVQTYRLLEKGQPTQIASVEDSFSLLTDEPLFPKWSTARTSVFASLPCDVSVMTCVPPLNCYSRKHLHVWNIDTMIRIHTLLSFVASDTLLDRVNRDLHRIFRRRISKDVVIRSFLTLKTPSSKVVAALSPMYSVPLVKTAASSVT
jgi:hypothetical protein